MGPPRSGIESRDYRQRIDLNPIQELKLVDCAAADCSDSVASSCVQPKAIEIVYRLGRLSFTTSERADRRFQIVRPANSGREPPSPRLARYPVTNRTPWLRIPISSEFRRKLTPKFTPRGPVKVADITNKTHAAIPM